MKTVTTHHGPKKIAIDLHQNRDLKPLPDMKNLGFGQHFTDHMFIAEFSSTKGWHDCRVVPFQPLSLHPGASVLHYGQSLFEGMKAFSRADGNISLFRPAYNVERMRKGAERLCMQSPPAEIFIEGVEALVKQDVRWIPKTKGSALYIRPTLIGSEGFLGVRPSTEFIFFVILSPVGAYYSSGTGAVKIWVETEMVRACNGGLGATKAGANYAASLLAALEAKKKGYSQVLWLDADHRFIEEVGTMNVFFVLKDRVVTPELSGSILPGGVRDSMLVLMRERGVKVEERRIAIQELLEWHKSGSLVEAFGTGTAAVITPVSEFNYFEEKLTLPEIDLKGSSEGRYLSQNLYQQLTALQHGESPDPYGWVEILEV